jgi:polyphosphate kinase 2 (PPK2 family)
MTVVVAGHGAKREERWSAARRPTYAPWVLIEAEDKHFARIKVLREACKRITARL